jgi:magnesium transporter
MCWVNVDGLGDERTIRRLGEMFEIHPLALEDVVHVHQRAKVEEYPQHLFIVMRMVWVNDSIHSEQLSMFLREGLVLTFQEHLGDCLDPVRQRLKDHRSSLRGLTAGHLAYAIIDAVVDGYYPVVQEFGDWIEELEDRIPHERGAGVIGEVHEMRRDLLYLRRCIWPLRETLHILVRDQHRQFAEDTRLHLRDAYDHAVQIMDVVETYREMCADLRDFYYAVVSQRTNEVMKVLTIVATIFMPLGFIAGLYGMNFDTEVSPWNMPELKWRFGYLYALVVMFSVAAGMLLFIWRRGWLNWSDVKDSNEGDTESTAQLGFPSKGT